MQILIKTFHIYFKPKRINLLFQPKVHLDRALASFLHLKNPDLTDPII